MNKKIARSMDTGHVPIDRLSALLESFAIKHAARDLASVLEQVEMNRLSYYEFLLDLFEMEVKGRNSRRRKRNYAAAHFPPNPKQLDLFDPRELGSGISQSQIHQLKELNWIDTNTNTNIVLSGLPGLGKTMIATGFGLEAIQNGYTVCVERMANFMKMLDTAESERSAGRTSGKSN